MLPSPPFPASTASGLRGGTRPLLPETVFLRLSRDSFKLSEHKFIVSSLVPRLFPDAHYNYCETFDPDQNPWESLSPQVTPTILGLESSTLVHLVTASTLIVTGLIYAFPLNLLLGVCIRRCTKKQKMCPPCSGAMPERPPYRQSCLAVRILIWIVFFFSGHHSQLVHVPVAVVVTGVTKKCFHSPY